MIAFHGLNYWNGTVVKEVARTLLRALGSTSDPLFGAYRTEDGSEGRQKS